MEDRFKKLVEKCKSSLQRKKKDTQTRNPKSLRVKGDKGFQCHLGFSVDTQGNGESVKHSRRWMAKVVTPFNPDGYLLKNGTTLTCLLDSLSSEEAKHVKLEWCMVPYLLASIEGNQDFVDSPEVCELMEAFRSALQDMDPECLDKMSQIPECVQFPKGSLFTALTVTILVAEDGGFEVLVHVDEHDALGAKGFSYRVNTEEETTGGLHVGDAMVDVEDGSKQFCGNVQRLPIGNLNIGCYREIPHAVYKPSSGRSYGIVGYQKGGVLKHAQMVEDDAKMLTSDEKDELKGTFAYWNKCKNGKRRRASIQSPTMKHYQFSSAPLLLQNHFHSESDLQSGDEEEQPMKRRKRNIRMLMDSSESDSDTQKW